MNLALFDFDGTITTGDTFIPFLRYSARPVKLALGAVALSPLFVGYKLGVVSGSAGRPIAARFAFRGEPATLIRDRGRRYARDVLPRVIRWEATQRLDWHKKQGDRVVVVSGSLDVYLNTWCESVGVEGISTILEEKNDVLTGRYIHGDCSGAEKVRRIRARHDLSAYARIYAYGDTNDDREMMSIAHEAYYCWRRIR
jgi:phosphatidylglycerophosphatase C